MVTIIVRNLKSLKEKTLGLLGKAKPYPVLFQTRFGIHTFGMKYPIDVVILSKECIVKKVEKNLQPNRLFFWNPVYNRVLELPHGMVRELHLHPGMPISLRSL